MKRILFWAVVILALGGMVWGLAKLGATSGPSRTGGTLAEPVSASDWKRGNQLAKTTLVEYSDFQCPACGAYFGILESLLKKYGNQLQFVYRSYPLQSHEHARIAAQAAEAAGKQNKFWEMHDLLFTNQSTWSNTSDPTSIFKGYAESLGLQSDQFLKDLDSTEVKNNVTHDIDTGNQSGVDATPTFYLNGKKLTNLQSYGDLEIAIKDALAAK